MAKDRINATRQTRNALKTILQITPFAPRRPCAANASFSGGGEQGEVPTAGSCKSAM